MLRSREESVDRFLERCVFRKGMEFAHHRARNRKPARNVFHLRESRFLRCADVNEKCDEDQEWVPNQPDEPEDECKSLTDACRHLRRARITQARCKEGAQDAPAIHWKRRQQIEEEQQDVDRQQLCNETAPFNVGRIKKRLRATGHKQAERNHDVHHRPSQGDHQFLHGLLRHAFQSRDPADWKQGNIRRVDPKSLRRERVPKFVQNDTSEKQQDEEHPGRRCR